MPVTPTYPGIYIQEAPSSSHTVVASPTNIAVFIGYTHPLKTAAASFGKAIQIFGFMDYQRQFGGFVRSAAFATQASVKADAGKTVGDMASAVNQFFLNGGTTCYIVALNAMPAATPPTVDVGGITFSPREIVDGTYKLSVSIRPSADKATADIILTYGPASGAGTVTETYRRVTLTPTIGTGAKAPADPNFIGARIGAATSPVSSLVTVDPGAATTFTATSPDPTVFGASLADAAVFFKDADFTDVLQEDTSLDKVPVMNLMVLPGVEDPLVLSTAVAFCERKMCFLIMDPPILDSADGTLTGFSALIQDTANGASLPRSKNAALYFPYIQSPDPVTGASINAVTGLVSEIPPAPTVAGIYAATDVSRGVWKAPAGFQAKTNNTTGVVERGRMTDMRQGTLNPISVNCLRDFPNVGTIVFGSRTLASTFDEQWEYVPVRRMALFLEQTFLANLKWVLFEPNDEPLWTAITMSLNAFMLGLFKQGAFQGAKPSEAFSVQCNSQTTTQADIDSGIVNIVVSFAPLKPAEFVVVTIAQLAGQTQTS